MSTYFPSGKNIEATRKWYVVDAAGQTVGRLASQVAQVLMGKTKPTYTPFIDTGDHVIIVNADKVVFSGDKWKDKFYRHHTGWPGGFKEIAAGDLMKKHPERILESAIKGMLPKTKMGRAMASKLKVYVGPDHPHQAQQPEKLDVKTQAPKARV
jgi:large subunit ribosomal protein L13